MGIPATELFANNGKYQSYRIYVWLADKPDGPIWRLMDKEFDNFDRCTGKHVAFFVDPFQRSEWGADFLQQVGISKELADQVLAARSWAQGFYRERLSLNLAEHLRIGREHLPVAIVSLQWDAPSGVVCFLKNEHDLRDLFESLIRFAESPDDPHTWRSPNRRSPPRGAMRLLEEYLHPRFETQIREFPHNLLSVVKTTCAPGEIQHFVSTFRERGTRHPALYSTGHAEAAGSFGLFKSYVALSALDDLLGAVMGVRSVLDRVEQRHPGDPDVAELKQQFRRIGAIAEQIAALSLALQEAAVAENEDAAADAFAAFEGHVREFDLDQHLGNVLGEETFKAMQPPSREAVAASELIYLVSQRLDGLRRDLTAVLVGYCKASELEGRRIMKELLDREFRIVYECEGKRQTVERKKLDGLTLGSLACVFKGLQLAPGESAPRIPAAQLGRLLAKVTHSARNRFVHRDVLNDPEKLEEYRKLLGGENPTGLLQLMADSLRAIDGSATINPPLATTRIPPSGQL